MEPLLLHPFAVHCIREEVAHGLMERDQCSWFKAHHAACEAVTAEVIAEHFPTQYSVPMTVGLSSAAFDGHIIKQIEQWMKDHPGIVEALKIALMVLVPLIL